MPTPEEVLTIGLDLDITGALKDLAAFQRKMSAQMGAVTDTVDKLSKANERMAKKAAKGTREWEESVEDLEESVDKLEKVLANLERRAKKASGEEKRRLEQEIATLRRVAEEKKKGEKKEKGKRGVGEAEAAAKGAVAGALAGLAGREAKDIGRDIFGGMRGGMQSLFQKDLKGSIAGGGKLLSGIMEGTFKVGGGLFKRGGKVFGDQAGSFLMRKSQQQMAKGGMKGKMAGGGLAGVGAALKGLGGMFKAVGPLLNTLSKIGPLVGMLSSALMGVVQLLIDLDSRAKDFNRSILQTAGNAEFLANNFYDSELAAGDMEDTLKGVRDAAYSLKNIDWGITADEHKAVYNTLNQEGVAFADVSKWAKASKRSVEDFSFELVKVSVGISRNLGVPLQEINQMQAEMITELGSSLDETKLAFAQMTRAATESGIAGNKFFAMIRGVSQDLALYNTRMGSASKLLKEVGKAMNPRAAQQFMQFAMQGLKSMDQDARMRLNLLTGGKGKGIVTKDLERKGKLLVRDIRESFVQGSEALAASWSEDKIQEALSKGGIERAQLLRDVGKMRGGGALVGAAEEMKIDRSAVKKGEYGVAAAMRNLSAGGSLEMMRAGIMKFSGAKSLSEGIGSIGQDKMAQMLGISEEQVRGMAKLEGHLMRQRELLKADLESSDEKVREDAKQRLEAAGITEEQLKSNQVGMGALMETLSDKDRKQAEEDSETQLDVSKRQADMQTSMLQKFEILVNFLMNQLYNVLLDIWEAVESIMDPLGSEKEKRKAKRAILETKDPEMIKAMRDMGENLDAYALRGKASDVYGKALTEKVQTDEGRAQVLKVAQEQLTHEDIMAAGAMGGVSKAKMDKLRSKLYKKVTATEAGMAPAVSVGGPGTMAPAMAMAGATKVTVPIEGVDFGQAMRDAGFSPDEISHLLEKGIWAAAPSRAVSFATRVGKPEAKKEAKVQAEEQAKVQQPSAQQQASAKTAAPPGQPAAAASGVGTLGQDEMARRLGGGMRGSLAAAVEAARAKIRPGGSGGTLEGKAEEVPATAKGQGQLHEDMSRMEKRLSTKGIRYDKSFLTGDYGSEIEKRVLDAMRVALVEFAIYKDADKEALVRSLGKADPKTFGKDLLQAAQTTKNPADFAKSLTTGTMGEGTPTQTGGYVVGRNPDGTARVLRPPAGESPAFVGPGESIMSRGAMAAMAGGGRGGLPPIQVSVNGVGGRELARIIEAKVADGVYEYKRREGFS